MGSETKIQVISKAFLLVLIGAFLGLGHNAISSLGIPLMASERLTLSDYVNWNLHLKGMRVDLPEAKKIFDRGDAIFLDARSLRVYNKGHIPGARHIRGYDLRKKGGEMLEDIPKDARVITYCSGGTCQSSVQLANILVEEQGYTSVGTFFGGWAEWERAGYPVKTGEKP
jgi:rhodanese-related sulfurtransferase